MSKFLEVLNSHFRFMGDRDFLPHGIKGRKQLSDERLLLGRMMRDLGYHIGAEIGTRYGHSAKIWCENVPNLKLFCIDPYNVYRVRKSQEKQDAVYEEARRTLEPFDVTFVRESSIEVADRFEDGSLDFVNIDGDHAFDMVMQDILLYVPKVRKGGMILIHDYYNFHQGGIVQAVNAYTTCHCINPWFTTRDLEPTAFWEKGAERI